MSQKSFWERMEDNWKDYYRTGSYAEGSWLRTQYKDSFAESFLGSGNIGAMAGSVYSMMQDSRSGSGGKSSQQKMPKAGNRRTSAGKSVAAGTFKAGKVDLGYTARVDEAIRKLSTSRTPEIAATYRRLNAKKSRGPLISLESPEIRVRRS